jgi:hypothetical protein
MHAAFNCLAILEQHEGWQAINLYRQWILTQNACLESSTFCLVTHCFCRLMECIYCTARCAACGVTDDTQHMGIGAKRVPMLKLMVAHPILLNQVAVAVALDFGNFQLAVALLVQLLQ